VNELKSIAGFQVKKWFQLCSFMLCCLALGCGGPAQSRVDLRQEAVRLNDEGYQYYRESKWRLAQIKFTEALKYNRLIDHRPGIASNLNNLGAVAQEQGNLAAAQIYYQDALTIQQENGDGAGICEALNNLGTVYATQGRWAEADHLHQQALGYARSLPPGPLLALTLTRLGDVARHEKNFAPALDLYQQALAIDAAGKNREGMAVRWGRLGRTYLDLGNYPEAGRYLHMALEELRGQQQTGGIVDALDGLVALALAQGDRPGAQLYGQRLLKIYQARGQTREAEQLAARLQKPLR
jgi:tetratricopeptide (TPR) repeat protein